MSQFKEMKFWIGDDKEVYHDVVHILFRLGYTFFSKYQPSTVVVTTKGGQIWNHNIDHNMYDNFEKIDVSWMRTPKKETIELNGKKSLKEDLEEALKHLKPVGE